MSTPFELPLPQLVKGRFAYTDAQGAPAGAIEAYTDPALFKTTGVRIAFTLRHGGASKPPYDSLNLGTHVKDDPAAGNLFRPGRRRKYRRAEGQKEKRGHKDFHHSSFL